MAAIFNPADAHFWVAIALVVFVAILWRAKVPTMALDALDAAGERVQAQLDEAAHLRAEAAEVLADIKRQREETERQAAEMLRIAQVEADRLRAEAAVKLDEDIRRRGALAERRIAAAEAQAAADVRAAAVDLAVDAAAAALAARLEGRTSDPLIDAALGDLADRFSPSAVA